MTRSHVTWGFSSTTLSFFLPPFSLAKIPSSNQKIQKDHDDDWQWISLSVGVVVDAFVSTYMYVSSQ
jgi:hypothetical protein